MFCLFVFYFIAEILMSNLQIIQEYSVALWDTKNLDVIEHYCAPDVKAHSPISTIQGVEEMCTIMTHWHVGFPHLKVYWDDFICEDNKVVSRWHAKGIHEGEFLGIAPTYRTVKYSGVTIYHMNNNKITEYWAYVNIQHIKEQLLA
jgi:predicted ester cyclase